MSTEQETSSTVHEKRPLFQVRQSSFLFVQQRSLLPTPTSTKVPTVLYKCQASSTISRYSPPWGMTLCLTTESDAAAAATRNRATDICLSVCFETLSAANSKTSRFECRSQHPMTTGLSSRRRCIHSAGLPSNPPRERDLWSRQNQCEAMEPCHAMPCHAARPC